jgi:tetratricopeptide (TPR) repeat protein
MSAFQRDLTPAPEIAASPRDHAAASENTRPARDRTAASETAGVSGPVGAVRQESAPRRRVRGAAALLVGSLVTAVALTAGAVLIPGSPEPGPAALSISSYGTASGAGSYGVAPTGDLAQAVEGLQTRLRRLPKDYVAWAELGSAYVQRSRQTAGPSYYPKAEQAIARSLALSPGNFAALTGQAALAAGRHEFADAVRLSRQAIAANPYGSIAYGVLADAHTQLGEHDQASKAIDTMMSLAPGVSSFTRASYDAELRGDLKTARRMLEHALGDAFTPGDIAYCRYYLGELSLHAGDLGDARSAYEQALKADPTFVPALAARARTAALDGRFEEAADDYEAAVQRLPLPQYLVEYGEVLERLGEDPSGQWALLHAQRDLMRASGVRDDLTWAEFEADHGSPAKAVEHAQAEYARNPNLVAADALAWALYRDGKPGEALTYTKRATATGWRNALLVHHRAVIERTLGLDSERSSALVKKYNPHFDPKLPALQRFS